MNFKLTCSLLLSVIPADLAETLAALEPRGQVDTTSSSCAQATNNSSDSNSVDGTPVAVSEESTFASVSGDTGISLLAIKQEPLEEHENSQFEDPEEEQLPCGTPSQQAEEDDVELDDHLTNCFVCGEPFGANHLLRRAAYHAEHRLCYTCHLCPLRFGKLCLLTRHLKQHSTSH